MVITFDADGLATVYRGIITAVISEDSMCLEIRKEKNDACAVIRR